MCVKSTHTVLLNGRKRKVIETGNRNAMDMFLRTARRPAQKRPWEWERNKSCTHVISLKKYLKKPYLPDFLQARPWRDRELLRRSWSEKRRREMSKLPFTDWRDYFFSLSYLITPHDPQSHDQLPRSGAALSTWNYVGKWLKFFNHAFLLSSLCNWDQVSNVTGGRWRTLIRSHLSSLQERAGNSRAQGQSHRQPRVKTRERQIQSWHTFIHWRDNANTNVPTQLFS